MASAFGMTFRSSALLRALIEEQLQGAPALRSSALDQPPLDTIGERLVVEGTAVLREDLGALDHRARPGANGRLDGLSQGRENNVVTGTLTLGGEADGVFGLLTNKATEHESRGSLFLPSKRRRLVERGAYSPPSGTIVSRR